MALEVMGGDGEEWVVMGGLSSQLPRRPNIPLLQDSFSKNSYLKNMEE